MGKDIDWDAKIKEALERTEFMAFSTVGKDGSWTNPLQYGYNSKFELFFVSMMHAKHVKNLLKDPHISVAIYKTERFPGPEGDVLGLQLKGDVVQLTDKDEIAEGSRCLDIEPSSEWKFFKITPSELWCFDSREFGEERMQVDLNNLSL